jgi:hypothetical protein
MRDSGRIRLALSSRPRVKQNATAAPGDTDTSISLKPDTGGRVMSSSAPLDRRHVIRSQSVMWPVMSRDICHAACPSPPPSHPSSGSPVRAPRRPRPYRLGLAPGITAPTSPLPTSPRLASPAPLSAPPCRKPDARHCPRLAHHPRRAARVPPHPRLTPFASCVLTASSHTTHTSRGAAGRGTRRSRARA